MSKIAISSLIALTITTTSGIATAKNNWLSKPGRFYVGADVMMRHMGYDQNLGKDLIARDSTAHNVYGGMHLNDYFALEVGHTIGHNKESRLTTGDRVLSASLMPGCIEMHHVLKAKYSAWNFGISGFSKYYKNKVRLVGTLGLSRARIDFHHRVPWCRDAMGIARKTLNQELLNARTYTTIPRAAIRLETKITDKISINLGTTWEATSKLGKFIDNHKQDNRDYIAKPKNSLSYSLGLSISL